MCNCAGGSVFGSDIKGFEMYSVIVACLILLISAASAEMKPKACQFGDCVGHETPKQLEQGKYMAQYNSCADANGPINNSVVYLCADKVVKTAQRDVKEKIAHLMRTDLRKDKVVLLEAQELWVEYVQKQCEIQAKYVGSPMISYCPMLKWIERNKELDLLLSSFFVN